jgi:uncharacterized protein DUF3800
MELKSPPPVCDVFIDESSQTSHRYLVIGGIIAPSADVFDLTNRILKTRLPELPNGEMKWGKVSRGKLAAYKRVVDFFFSAELQNQVHFHSLVVDTSKHDHARFNSGSREIGFNKEVFQLAQKFTRIYPTRLNIYPDERVTDQSLDEMRLMLNRYINRRIPQRDWPFRRVQFRDSKKTPLLQLADTLSGAIAFRLNGHDKKIDVSPAKLELSAHILGSGNVKDVFRDTNVRGRFTIWHRQLK